MCICVLNKMSNIVRRRQKMIPHSYESQYTADRRDTGAGELSGSEPAASVSSGGEGQAKRTETKKRKFRLRTLSADITNKGASLRLRPGPARKHIGSTRAFEEDDSWTSDSWLQRLLHLRLDRLGMGYNPPTRTCRI